MGEQLKTKEKTVRMGGLEESRRGQKQGDIPNCGWQSLRSNIEMSVELKGLNPAPDPGWGLLPQVSNFPPQCPTQPI